MSKANFFKPRIYLFFSIGLLLQTCIDPYEFNIVEPDNILVVDGKITNTTEPQSIRLTYTTEFGKTNNPPATGATVELKTAIGESVTLLETEEGVYILEENSGIQGTIGETYHIEITLLNGKRYASTPETMQPTPVIDSIYYQFNSETVPNEFGAGVTNNYIQIVVGTPIIPIDQGLLLRWDVEDVYMRAEPLQPWNPFFVPKVCFKHENTNPQDVVLLDATNIQTSRIDDNIVATKQLDVTFWEAHYFNVTQYSLTKNAYNYWFEIDKIANNVGGLFDTPPATIRGNIYSIDNESELVLGYFEASSSSIIRVKTFKQDIPYDIQNPCETSWNVPEQCLNCLIIPGSTLDRPDYW